VYFKLECPHNFIYFISESTNATNVTITSETIPKIFKINFLFLPFISLKSKGIPTITNCGIINMTITLSKIAHHVLYQSVFVYKFILDTLFIISVVSFSIGKEANPIKGIKNNVERIIDLINQK
ncbi:MAG: hypothetical protein ACKVH2_07075, partial [Flavobacteriales bacterium]